MRWQLPENVNPPDTVCIQFQVPDDPYYLAAFWGAITELGNNFNWQRDSAHTAAKAAMVMRKMYLQAQDNNCPLPCPGGPGFEVDDVNIKQDPDNPCLLREVCPDGTLGCVVFDASLCKPNTAPGGGSTPPGAGVCQDYEFSLDASIPTLMPFVVNSGDTLKIDSATGAAVEGFNWYCPDGEYYLLGGCAGGQHTVSVDPVNTFSHMALIWKIGASYYGSAIGSTFTVPGGFTNAQVWMQVNTSSFTDVGGIEQAKITYCNNATPPATSWCREIDFTLSPYGWGALTGTDANGQPFGPSFWTGGLGWENHPQIPPPSTSYEYYCLLRIDLGAMYTIDYAAITGHVGNATGGTLPEEVDVIFNTADSIGGTAVGLLVGHPSRNADYSLSNSPSPYTGRYLFVFSQGYGMASPDDPIFQVKTLQIKGTGAAPGVGVAC